jgi:hypothetical protein
MVWAAALVAVAVPLAWTFFSGSVYIPVLGMALIAALPSIYRLRNLRRGLPEPYGRGRVSVIDTKSAIRSGMFMVLGGIVCVVFLLGSIYFVPAFAVFAMMFSLAGGLPLSQVVFFIMVFTVERASRSRIFEVVTDETTDDENPRLTKSFEMSPM